MKSSRVLLAGLALASVASLAYLVAQQPESSGAQMVAAAQNFLNTLTAEQKTKATFDYDSKERTNWNFIPLQDMKNPDPKVSKSTRKGLSLEGMNAEQKKAALGLVKAGTGDAGNAAALTIMSLEGVLRELETGKGVNVRSPEWYFVTIFGTPAKTGKWGWRVEGHHLSINVTLDGTQIVAASPSFFGANPATIKAGPRKGERTLAGAQDIAAELFKSLDAEQKKVALQDKKFPEPGEKTLSPKVGAPVGLPVAKMTEAQKVKLLSLVDHYLARQTREVIDEELKGIRAAGIEKIHFAYEGSTEEGKGRTYRVQGPTFVIEYINEQADSAGNPANHIHSAYRRIKGDFGL